MGFRVTRPVNDFLPTDRQRAEVGFVLPRKRIVPTNRGADHQVRRSNLKGPSRYPSKVAIRHLGEAARALGIRIGTIEISPDGLIRVLDCNAAPITEKDEFAEWFGNQKSE